MTEQPEQAPDEGVDPPRDPRAIVDAIEAQLDEQYPDHTDPEEQEPGSDTVAEPGAEKPGSEPPD